MSRHVIVDRPSLQLVLGFDHMLRSFFGQVFNPANKRREGMAVGGWPTRSGLGTRRPARTIEEAGEDLRLLIAWAKHHQPAGVGEDAWSAHLRSIRTVLMREWDDGTDSATPPIPVALQEGR
ncbi:hypothetical protein MKK70_04925 [Methylobacterium sp. E-041]|uniref:hypothetical protein n=1 Tax=Methylobacterium sp. E-041 TaxID=2836573 RepID=UPI001FB9F175|nr:hypothetical protein [Methylobacterium sp. E-041]MCJ2104730.1 hypothetical protein [Methylobacterium sp. E-041]